MFYGLCCQMQLPYSNDLIAKVHGQVWIKLAQICLYHFKLSCEPKDVTLLVITFTYILQVTNLGVRQTGST